MIYIDETDIDLILFSQQRETLAAMLINDMTKQRPLPPDERIALEGIQTFLDYVSDLIDDYEQRNEK